MKIDLLTPEEAAQELGITTKALKLRAWRGKLKRVKLGSEKLGRVRFHRAEIEQYKAMQGNNVHD